MRFKLGPFLFSCALSVLGLLSPAELHAQYLGNVGLQTVDATLASSVACTGSPQNFTTGTTPGFSNLGQTFHAAYLTSSSISSGTMVIQGSMDGVNFQNISDTASIAGFIAGTPNSFVVGAGRYTLIRVSVSCNTAGGATFSLLYSGSQTAPGAAYGAQNLTQYDKTIVDGLTMGSNFTSSRFQPPFGNQLGVLNFSTPGTPPANSVLAVQCQVGVAVFGAAGAQVTLNFPIATAVGLQSFQIPSLSCSSLNVQFTSGGASATAYYLDYMFVAPGQIAGSPSAATLTSALNFAPTLSEKGARWSVVSSPAAGSQATASQAAGAISGTRHVADCVTVSAGAAAAPAATVLTVNLRDGATGAGTVKWTTQITAAASAANHGNVSICGLNLIGSANTAMTLEFSAALASESESVTLTGYDVQ